MLAWIIRAQLVLELFLYAAGGNWLVRAHGWSVPAVVALAVGLALGVRLAIVSLTTTIGWFTRTPRAAEHAMGPLATIGYVLGEWRAMLLDNFYELPFEGWAVRPDPPAPGEGIPVLLVHGYFSNRGVHRAIVKALDAACDTPVFTFNFGQPFTPIEALAGELEQRVERVLERTGAPKLILVCHSMGGLVARAWMGRHGAGRVAKLITIASPHHGTALARLGLGPNAKQMRRGSDFLLELALREREWPHGIPATSIYSPHDNLVTPQETSRLPWAKNVAIAGLGHVDILASAKMHQVLVDELCGAGVGRRLGAQDGGASRRSSGSIQPPPSDR